MSAEDIVRRIALALVREFTADELDAIETTPEYAALFDQAMTATVLLAD